MAYVKKLKEKGLIDPERYVYDQLQYEVIMGSFAYGVSSDNSDVDVYGFCIPNKNIIFPHEQGNFIFGYDKTVPQNFEQFQKHHIKTETQEFDLNIYNITKFFRLCVEGNPNMIDSLFVPVRCVTHATAIGNLVRENRNLFLSKKCWHTFKGYAYNQVHLMKTKNPEGKRKELIEKYGFDVKFAYHIVRLLNEVEQILTEGDLDVERNRAQLKAIRRGDWTENEILEYFSTKEKDLESVYLKSELRNKAEYDKVRDLLYTCLEMHFATDVKPKNANDDRKLLLKLKEMIDEHI